MKTKIKETIKIEYYFNTEYGFKSLSKLKNGIKTSTTYSIKELIEEDRIMYYAHLDEPGGPLLNNRDINVLKEKFMEAFSICLSMESLINMVNKEKLREKFL